MGSWPAVCLSRGISLHSSVQAPTVLYLGKFQPPAGITTVWKQSSDCLMKKFQPSRHTDNKAQQRRLTIGTIQQYIGPLHLRLHLVVSASTIGLFFSSFFLPRCTRLQARLVSCLDQPNLQHYGRTRTAWHSLEFQNEYTSKPGGACDVSLTVLSSGLGGSNSHISDDSCNMFPPGFMCSHAFTNRQSWESSCRTFKARVFISFSLSLYRSLLPVTTPTENKPLETFLATPWLRHQYVAVKSTGAAYRTESAKRIIKQNGPEGHVPINHGILQAVHITARQVYTSILLVDAVTRLIYLI